MSNLPIYEDLYPKEEDRVKVAYNRATKLQELMVGSKLIYMFKSREEYREFALQTHAMENPLGEPEYQLRRHED
jgi:hypothetical protein